MTKRAILLAAGLAMLPLTSPQAAHAEVFDGATGPDQVLFLDTSPRIPSNCSVSNDAGSWTTFTTPSHLSIMKSSGSFTIDCVSNNGIWHGRVSGKPRFDGLGSIVQLPYAALKLGSALVQGDSPENGALYGTFVSYNSPIVVPLTRQHNDLSPARPATPDEIAASRPQDQGSVAATDAPPEPVHHRRHHHHHAARSEAAPNLGS